MEIGDDFVESPGCAEDMPAGHSHTAPLGPSQNPISGTATALTRVRVKSNPLLVGSKAAVSPTEKRGRAKSDDDKPRDAAFLSRLYQPSDDEDDEEEDTPPGSPPMVPAEPGTERAGLAEAAASLETPPPSRFSGYDEVSSRFSSSMNSAMSCYEQAKSSYNGSMRRGPQAKIEMLWRTTYDFLSFEEFCGATNKQHSVLPLVKFCWLCDKYIEHCEEVDEIPNSVEIKLRRKISYQLALFTSKRNLPMAVPVSLSPVYHVEPLDLGALQSVRDELASTLEGETGVVEQYFVSAQHETRLKESQDNWLMDALYVNHFSEFLSQQVPMATELLHFCLDYRRLLRKDAHQRPQVLSHIYKHYLRAGGAAEADLRKHDIEITQVLVEEASRMALRVEEEEKGRQSSIGTPARTSSISMSITIPPSMNEAERGSSMSFRDGTRDVKVFNTTNERILVSTFSTMASNAANAHSITDHGWRHPRRQRHVEPGQTAVVDVVSSGVETITLHVNAQKYDAIVTGCVYTYDGEALIPQRLSSFEQHEPSAESLPRLSVEEARSVEIEAIEEDMTQETFEADPLMAVEELSHIYEEVVRRLQSIQPAFLMSEEYGALLDKKAHYSGDWVPQTQHDSEEVLHKGYLNKKGQGFADFLRWRNRYFVLTRNGDFCYYKHQRAYERGDPPMGAIQCCEVTNLSCQASNADFHVETAQRGYHLSCSHSEERSTWVSVLQEAGVPRDVCYADMKVRKMIGSGSQAAVAEVVDMGTGKGMAMKVYNLAELIKQENGQKVQHVVNERQLLSELKHPYIITGQAAFHEGDKLFICMDFANGGELWYHMYRNKDCPLHRQYKQQDGGSVLGIVLASFYIAEVVLAIGYLHAKAILFADLKPENVAIDSEGHVKLIDFGQCRRGITSMTGEPGDGVPYESSERLGGTHEYFAPELVTTKRKGPLGKALDWWTVGVLFFELMMKVTPFKSTAPHQGGPGVDFEAIKEGEWTQEWVESPGMPFHAQNLAASLLDPDPVERLGTRGTVEIMRHPFFGEMNLADWARLQRVQVPPPWIPNTSSGVLNFDQVEMRKLDEHKADFCSAQPLKTAEGTMEMRRLSEVDPAFRNWAFTRRDGAPEAQQPMAANPYNTV